MPFSRTDDGKIYQRPFGGHMTNNGKGNLQAELVLLLIEPVMRSYTHSTNKALRTMFSFIMNFMQSTF